MATLAGGHDFVSNPRLSPDGSQLAWVGWDHPNMPWDDTTLYLAQVQPDGSLQNTQKAGLPHGVFASGPCDFEIAAVPCIVTVHPDGSLCSIQNIDLKGSCHVDTGPSKRARVCNADQHSQHIGQQASHSRHCVVLVQRKQASSTASCVSCMAAQAICALSRMET